MGRCGGAPLYYPRQSLLAVLYLGLLPLRSVVDESPDHSSGVSCDHRATGNRLCNNTPGTDYTVALDVSHDNRPFADPGILAYL